VAGGCVVRGHVPLSACGRAGEEGVVDEGHGVSLYTLFSEEFVSTGGYAEK